MRITNWHTSGRANKAKTANVNLQSVYFNKYSAHPVEIFINDRTNEDKITFLTVTLTKDEAQRLQEKLNQIITQL